MSHIKSITPLLISFFLIFSVKTSFAGSMDDVEKAHNNGDYKPAIQLLKIASEKGDAEAQHCLGVMYALGQGEPRNNKKAIFWLNKSADQDFQKAEYSLGYIYGFSDNGSKDISKALFWLNKAKIHGHPDADYMIEQLQEQKEFASID